MKVKSKNRIQPEEAMKILKQEGMEVSVEQAQLLLDFLYKFAKISLAVLVGNPKSEWHRKFDSYRAIIEEMGFQTGQENQPWPKTLTEFAFQWKSIISIRANEMEAEKMLSNSLKRNTNKCLSQ